MFKGLLENLRSKKFWGAVVAAVIAAVCDQLGISSDIIYGILSMFGVQIAGQAYADGSPGGKEAVKAAKAELQAMSKDLTPAERAAVLERAALADDLK